MPLPWVRLAQLVPTVLGLSRELLDRRQGAQARQAAQAQPFKDLEARMAALEETQRREGELVHALAQQSAALAEAADALRRQARTVLVVACVAAALAAVALLVALLR
jgi:hypothetical protein